MSVRVFYGDVLKQTRTCVRFTHHDEV